VALPNSGNAVAGPFSVTDSVDGDPVSGAVVSTPAAVAAGASGTATVSAPTPLGRPGGPMTDVVAVTWQDKNGNAYGPVTSSFTTALAAGHPEGYVSISGATNFPDLTGSTKTLTVTALDSLGNPAAGVTVHVAVTGVNPQAADLTTGANGTAAFSFSGTNLGVDTVVASGTITTALVTSAPVEVQWATSVGTPCTGRATPLDVVIAIDSSGSMELDGKIQGAKASSKAFVDTLDFTRDQVAVVDFNGTGELLTPLTTDGAQAKAGIDAILINEFAGTSIGAGLDAALDELAGPRHRAGATPVLVFLTDGGNSVGDPEPALARLAASGVRAVALGLGSDADPVMLGRIASTQSDYFYAPTASELAWAYNSINQDVCRNHQPIVSAGGNQGFYEVRLPDLLTLSGEIHDDGPPGDTRLASEWTLVSGPAPVTFTDPTALVTKALFAEPGTYVVQLAATDGFLTVADRATIVVDADPSLVGANLVVALALPGPLTTGTTEAVTARLTDGLGTAIRNFPVVLTVAGANPATATAITDSTGLAAFSYMGTKAGTDVLHATAFGSTFQLDSSAVSLSWTEPATAGPVLTQGWIASPTTQTSVRGQVPVVLSPDVTLASGTLTYWPASAPDQVHVLAAAVSGGPGTTLATFDTTVLANGSYVLRLDGTSDAGTERVSQVLVTATGDYKPGRLIVEVTDMTIPIAGLPITVGRRYDSLEKDTVGDFGNGWSLMIGHPQLDVDPGNNVTITMPEGRRVTFFFEPSFPNVGPVILGFFLVPAYVAEPGVFGKLTSNGCSLLSFNPSADVPTPICLDSILDPVHLGYAPTEYTYTDPYGRQFVMAATGELKSIKDRQGNTLSFQPNGIISGADKTVTFARDAQGRITSVTSPLFGPLLRDQIEYDYHYDAAGDLESVDLPPSDGLVATTHYTYADHRLLTTVDPRGNPARTSTFDDSGRLLTDTDALNNTTSYAYDLATRTTRTTNPDTGVLTQVFDERGLVLSETDPLGRTTIHEYDANQNEIARTNAAGEKTTTTYDSNGLPTSVTDTVQHRTTHTAYNDFALPTAVTDALGHTTTTDYDDRDVPTRIADSLGTRFTYTSSEQGLPLTIDDAAGKRAYLTYDGAGNETSRTDPLARAIHSTYDELGRMLTQTSARGGLTQYTYTARGQVAAMSDPATAAFGFRVFTHDQNDNVTSASWPTGGRLINYTYDALNHLTEVHNADGTSTSYTYDFRGNKLTETDESARTTTYAYDLAGQLVTTTFPDGTSVARGYDALGRLASLTDERLGTTTYEYDPGCGCADRVTKVTDPLGRTRRAIYDATGRRVSVTDAAAHETDFVYDNRNNLIETDYPDGTAVHDGYDSLGRRLTTTDQTGATTTFGYDDAGQLTSVTDPLTNVTTYGYDADGDLAFVTDANNHTTSYDYDLARRKTKRTFPLGMFETFGYDPFGNQTSHTDFRGKTTTAVYDIRDHLLSKIPDPTLGEPTQSYVYFPTGTRASMTDASGTTSYTYDPRDHLLTKAAPAGTLAYTYDPSGNLATIRSSNANGTSVDYAWDAASQLVSVTDNRAGGVTTAAYTATGRPAALSQPNGVGANYSYDSLNRAVSMTWQKAAAPALAGWAYDYNARGQRLTATDITGRRATYGYDSASRFISETITNDPSGPVGNGALTYNLDTVGNRLSRDSTLASLAAQTFAYNPNDQLTSEGYDPNGNTISVDGNTYAYDFENRLVSKNGGAVSIVYDCDGNRVAKTVNGATTSYLVDDRNPTGYVQVLEEVSTGSVQTRYTFGNMLVSQTREVGGTPKMSYYGYDARGNIAFLTDSAGAVTDSYELDGWGNLIRRTGNTPNSRLFGGEEYDADLGLIVMRARYYDLGRGRFETVDPAAGQIGSPLALNRYLYANSDPINLMDPNGNTALTEWVVTRLLSAAVIDKILKFVLTYEAHHADDPHIRTAAQRGLDWGENANKYVGAGGYIGGIGILVECTIETGLYGFRDPASIAGYPGPTPADCGQYTPWP
jgi:RHS repeat-associated protein